MKNNDDAKSICDGTIAMSFTVPLQDKWNLEGTAPTFTLPSSLNLAPGNSYDNCGMVIVLESENSPRSSFTATNVQYC